MVTNLDPFLEAHLVLGTLVIVVGTLLSSRILCLDKIRAGFIVFITIMIILQSKVLHRLQHSQKYQEKIK